MWMGWNTPLNFFNKSDLALAHRLYRISGVNAEFLSPVMNLRKTSFNNQVSRAASQVST